MNWNYVDGNWFECAPSPMEESRRPQTKEEVNDFIVNFDTYRRDVWRRYVITKPERLRFISWMKDTWFFTNFTLDDLGRVRRQVFPS